jgi:hypothetical protein
MRLSKAPLASLALLAGLWLPLTGCQDCDTTGQTPIDYTQGTTNASRTHYESSPVHGEWLHFPAGRVYVLETNMVDGSLSVQSWVAFPDDHDSGKNPASYTEAAGNQVIIEDGDQRHIKIRNDTCAEFFVRIVANVAPTNGLASMGGGSAGGAGGASASGGSTK